MVKPFFAPCYQESYQESYHSIYQGEKLVFLMLKTGLIERYAVKKSKNYYLDKSKVIKSVYA